VIIAFTFAIGSFYARLYPEIIRRLDYTRFQEWISPGMLFAGWWVLLLLGLLFILGANTFACTTDRLSFLIRQRYWRRAGALFLAMSPSFMHIFFIIVMVGHGLTQFALEVNKVPVQPGVSIGLTAGSLTVENQFCTNWKEPGLDRLVKRCSATLELRTSGQSIMREVSIMHPVFWGDYMIHLGLSGKSREGAPPRLNLLIKKDPGLKPLLWGGAFFCMLMTWYYIKSFKSRRGGTSSC